MFNIFVGHVPILCIMVLSTDQRNHHLYSLANSIYISSFCAIESIWMEIILRERKVLLKELRKPLLRHILATLRKWNRIRLSKPHLTTHKFCECRCSCFVSIKNGNEIKHSTKYDVEFRKLKIWNSTGSWCLNVMN